MLTILMANPIQFIRVSAVPFNSGVTDEATKLENWGESAVTAIPQRQKATRKTAVGNWNSNGEIKQKSPEMNKGTTATFLLPNRKENSPPKMQETPPIAMMIAAHNGTEIASLLKPLNVWMAKGTKAQKA